ncbi:MAG: hypothetical protein JWQ30_1880 [Sediminibacterium sp.]|nr:hypothetical protein [Sediminibacterium sp.]
MNAGFLFKHFVPSEQLVGSDFKKAIDYVP